MGSRPLKVTVSLTFMVYVYSVCNMYVACQWNMYLVLSLGPGPPNGFGKGTFIKTTSDVDIFCIFNKSHKDDDLSKLLQKILSHSKINYKVNHEIQSKLTNKTPQNVKRLYMELHHNNHNAI